MKIAIPQLEKAVPNSDDGIDYLVNVYGCAAPDTYYHCPCCYYPTLSSRGSFDTCAVCYWEDDGQDDQDADRIRGGPNGHLSLSEARSNFRSLGACEERFCDKVRAPTMDEKSNRKHDN